MSKCVYELVFSGSKDIRIDDLKAAFPLNFDLKDENGKIVLAVDEPSMNDEQINRLVRRELDRIFFLTAHRIVAKLIECDGIKRLEIEIGWRVLKSLKGVKPQNWSVSKLEIQLGLWRLANEDNISLCVRILLLFQIIELEYPDRKYYPKYTNANISPDPLTECYLLRNLCAHQGTPNQEVKTYCSFLGVDPKHFDPYDEIMQKKIESRLPIIEKKAREIIASKITRK